MSQPTSAPTGFFPNASANGSGEARNRYVMIMEYADRTVLLVCGIVALVAVILGTFGNIMAFVALQYSSKRASSSNVYLRALAIGDLLTLIFSIIPSFLHFTVRPIFPDDAIILTHFFDRWGICLVIVYVAYASRAFATYIIVFFSLERCATILRPFKASSWFTPRTARRNVIICFIFAYTWALPGLFSKSKLPGRGSNPPSCRANKILFVFLKMQLCTLNLLPIIVVLTCNTIIVLILRRRSRDLNTPLSANQSTPLSANQSTPLSTNQSMPSSVNEEAPLSSHLSANPSNNQKVASKQERKVTRRLLIISTAFVVLILPILIVNLGRSVDELSGAMKTRTMGWANAIAITMTFWVGNFSINFLLYCLTWRHFRRACYAILTCNKEQLQHLSTHVAHHHNPRRHGDEANPEEQPPENSPAESSSTKSTFLTSRTVIRTPRPSPKLVRWAAQTAQNA